MLRKCINLGIKLASVAATMALPACKGAPTTRLDEASRPITGKTGVVGIEAARAFNQLSPADKDALKQKKVLFGHQSVGKNLIDGAQAIGFPFQAVDSGASFATVKWGDAVIQKNGDPLRKFASFKELVLAKGMGATVDVAAMKLCWIDFESGTDSAALLAKYDADVKAMRAAHPNLRILHVTPPLTTDEAKLNEQRWKFGRLLIEKYRGEGIVLDLAEVMAAQADGGLCEKRGAPRLCDEWASDSGHLNGPGSERAAKAFVVAVQRLLS
jgi:hypothetical protein